MMKHGRIRPKACLWVAVTGVLLAIGAGCNCSKDLKSCQEQNQAMAQQIADLEYQLTLADQTAAQTAPQTYVSTGESTYLVVAGDTLWSIARKQLGDGKRFNEILALNPQITKDTPLVIGSTLKMPAR